MVSQSKWVIPFSVHGSMVGRTEAATLVVRMSQITANGAKPFNALTTDISRPKKVSAVDL